MKLMSRQVLLQPLLENLPVSNGGQIIIDINFMHFMIFTKGDRGFNAVSRLREAVPLYGRYNLASRASNYAHFHDMPPPCKLWKHDPTPLLWMST